MQTDSGKIKPLLDIFDEPEIPDALSRGLSEMEKLRAFEKNWEIEEEKSTLGYFPDELALGTYGLVGDIVDYLVAEENSWKPLPAAALATALGIVNFFKGIDQVIELRPKKYTALNLYQVIVAPPGSGKNIAIDFFSAACAELRELYPELSKCVHYGAASAPAIEQALFDWVEEQTGKSKKLVAGRQLPAMWLFDEVHTMLKTAVGGSEHNRMVDCFLKLYEASSAPYFKLPTTAASGQKCPSLSYPFSSFTGMTVASQFQHLDMKSILQDGIFSRSGIFYSNFYKGKIPKKKTRSRSDLVDELLSLTGKADKGTWKDDVNHSIKAVPKTWGVQLKPSKEAAEFYSQVIADQDFKVENDLKYSALYSRIAERTLKYAASLTRHREIDLRAIEYAKRIVDAQIECARGIVEHVADNKVNKFLEEDFNLKEKIFRLIKRLGDGASARTLAQYANLDRVTLESKLAKWEAHEMIAKRDSLSGRTEIYVVLED